MKKRHQCNAGGGPTGAAECPDQEGPASKRGTVYDVAKRRENPEPRREAILGCHHETGRCASVWDVNKPLLNVKKIMSVGDKPRDLKLKARPHGRRCGCSTVRGRGTNSSDTREASVSLLDGLALVLRVFQAWPRRRRRADQQSKEWMKEEGGMVMLRMRAEKGHF